MYGYYRYHAASNRYLKGRISCQQQAHSTTSLLNAPGGVSCRKQPIWYKTNRVLSPPIAKKHPKQKVFQLVNRTQTVVDYYSWMQHTSKQLEDHVDQENKYTDYVMRDTRQLQIKLYNEMKARMYQAEQSVPEYIDGFFYYTKMNPNDNFMQYCRRRGSMDSKEEIVFDQNEEGKKHDYIGIGTIKMSPDHQKVMYTLDTTGDEIWTLYIKDLVSGSISEVDKISNVVGSEWANDGNTIFYTTPDKLKRPWQVKKHLLGTSCKNDTVVLQEHDDAFFVDVTKTKDKQFILINLNSKTTSEVHIIESKKPDSLPLVMYPRSVGIEYYVDHVENAFYIVTNADGAENFNLGTLPDGSFDKANWKTLIPHKVDTKIEDIDVFKNYIVVYQRRFGLPEVQVYNKHTEVSHIISLTEPICAVLPGINGDYTSEVVRFSCTSPLSPEITFDYDMMKSELVTLRNLPVIGDPIFQSEDYVCKREMVDSGNARIPLTLFYHKDLRPNARNPLLLTGYGAYGHNTDPHFRAEYLPLLQRNWVIGLAHIRGGGELGKTWYTEGKLLRKKNSVSDFVACAKFVISKGLSHPSLLAAYVASAGGLMLGAAINEEPDLFKAAVMRVPFVDITTSMQDPTLPLTVHEYDEWGNPNSPEVLEYMTSYDPYMNIRAQRYPSLLVTSSMMDNRVPFWHQTKYVSKLREHNTSPTSNILLQVDKTTGHFGDCGRYSYLQHIAFEYAFLAKQINVTL